MTLNFNKKDKKNLESYMSSQFNECLELILTAKNSYALVDGLLKFELLEQFRKDANLTVQILNKRLYDKIKDILPELRHWVQIKIEHRDEMIKILTEDRK